MAKQKQYGTTRRQLDSAALLHSIIEGTGNVTGESFFQTLVQKLAGVLGVDYAFIAEFDPDRHRARVLASWEMDHPGAACEFDLAGTPCETVIAGKQRVYSRDVQTLFPDDTMLLEMHAVGYIATPLIAPDGTVMGHLAVVDTKPIEWRQSELSVFDIFAIRAAAELDRLRARAELRRSEQWLGSLLSSVMDAVVVLDADRNVRIFNAAAERIFNTTFVQVQKQSFDRFLSGPLREAITNFILHCESHLDSARQIFLPDGNKALKATGEEFIVDATLSLLPITHEKYFILIIRDAGERHRSNALIENLREKTTYLKETANANPGLQNIVFGSNAMKDLMSRIEQVASTDSTVLLLGETGTGKELIAHALHNLSNRREHILVKLNCAAMPSELIESELFGHEKGAYTGAAAQRKGRFELADGGTLFLDEIGELSPAGQAKLLRVLQEQEFERVGGTATIRVNVRVIAATNRDLGDLVTSGKFRADLFYRLNVFPVSIPPLRDRLEDIPLLCKHFLAGMERKLGKRLTGIAPDSLRKMYRYSWPGNVRELQNIIERAAILATSPILDIDKLLPVAAPAQISPAPGQPATLREVEREHIELALELVNWVVEGEHGAAALLGMNPSTLRYRMQKLGLRRSQRAFPGSAGSGKTASDFAVLQDAN